MYARLYVSLASASQSFVCWVQENVQKLTRLHGVIEVQRRKERHYSPDLPALARKRAKAEPFMLKIR